MSGISRKRYRKPTLPGSFGFGGSALPSAITQELGCAMSEWGFVEQQFDILLSTVIGTPRIGKTIRNNVRTAKQRLALLRDLIKGAGSTYETRTLELLGTFEALSNERGLFAHCPWGTHTAYPDQAILLLDETYLDIGFPDVEAITSGRMANMMARTMENSALVSIRDLQRFRTALQRLSDKVSEVTVEMQMADTTAHIRASIARSMAQDPT